MKSKTAEELMIPVSHYPIVSDNDTLLDAIEEMDNIQIKSAGRLALPRVVLVFNEKTQLVGLVRRRDIFRGLEPGFVVKSTSSYKRKLFDVHIDPNLLEFSPNISIQSIKKNVNRKVREVMLPVAQTIEHTDHIMKILALMVEYNISLLPVMKNNRIVGVVRSADVLHYISHEILDINTHFRTV